MYVIQVTLNIYLPEEKGALMIMCESLLASVQNFFLTTNSFSQPQCFV